MIEFLSSQRNDFYLPTQEEREKNALLGVLEIISKMKPGGTAIVERHHPGESAIFTVKTRFYQDDEDDNRV